MDEPWNQEFMEVLIFGDTWEYVSLTISTATTNDTNIQIRLPVEDIQQLKQNQKNREIAECVCLFQTLL